ncbi:dTMP kinase [Corynebacterium halotolerans]|uniref:Thymidylate kinase n=1 Tax=Corynebacterium halotolerans YIM 70093 = DSM 44683 TaxID=1121362 RepID=M1MVJ8_9CORY|nr:dTMP kinase [Corynebacterium halotolerans]AGF71754.1 thymidylate kinase [Corynebacterium halotolerans YIM 70093 = DSM 44683]
MIITVEGIDGAGKNTLVRAVREQVEADVLAFPRYDDSVPAQLAAEALHGRMGDLTDSAYAMATLFALDRHGAKEQLEAYVGSDRVIILDRYVASNAAYSAARLRDDAVIDWVHDLEFGRLGLPKPDLQVLLATPPATASQRARSREAADASRARDAYERDADLQERTFEAYRRLAQRQWAGRWLVTTDPATILQEIT